MAIHNYKKGDWVFIINQSGGGEFFIEGKAQVVRAIKGMEDRYDVRLKLREGWEIFERYIDPSAQEDPYEFVSQLNARRREAQV